jgi:hypothetical protein
MLNGSRSKRATSLLIAGSSAKANWTAKTASAPQKINTRVMSGERYP